MLSTKLSCFLYDFFILFQYSQYYHIVAIEHLQILHFLVFKETISKHKIFSVNQTAVTFSERKKPPSTSILGQNLLSTIPYESPWAQPLPLFRYFSP